jgi:hypothetical protein
MYRPFVLLVLCALWLCTPGCLPSPVEDRTVGLGDEGTARDAVDDACAAELAPPPERPAASALDADPAIRTSQVFPDWSGACASCIQSDCSAQLERCASETACVDYAVCRWSDSDPSPASELRCGNELSQSTEDPDSAIRALQSCWQTSCVEACRLGTHWSCAGTYTVPAPGGAVARVTQVLQALNSDLPVSGASVRFCDAATPAEDCAQAIVAEGTSDAAGLAKVELPLATDDRPGWSGYRHVVGEEYGVRLQSNLIVTADRFMLQHVPTLSDAELLRPIFGGDAANGNIVFQVFDCARTGAERVELEVTRAADDQPVGGATRVRYQRNAVGVILSDSGGTTSVGDGGGSILDLPPGEWLWVRARRQCTGEVVAALRVRTLPGELLLLELHPDGGG